MAELRAGRRWLGIGSMMSVQLFADVDNLGALNLYAEKPGASSDADEDMGLLLAAHAAIAVIDARKIENLNLALQSRDVIGPARPVYESRSRII